METAVQQRDQDVGHEPSSEPTRGPFVAHGMTVWNGEGSIEVARCVSRQLCPAGNAANARKLADATHAQSVLEDLVAAGRMPDACIVHDPETGVALRVEVPAEAWTEFRAAWKRAGGQA